MHWIDYQIKLPLPPARMRSHLLMGIVAGWSLIPQTEGDLTTALACCVFPMLTAIHVAGYWRRSLFRTQLLIAFIATIAAFALHTMLAQLYGSVGSFSHFFILGWKGSSILLVPLSAQLFMVSLSLLAFHFIFRERHATHAQQNA
jgi:hypothetical protein